jgi:hypothetical protein
MDLLSLIFFQPTGGVDLKSVFFQQLRGPRGSAPTVSGGQDRAVLGQFVEAFFEIFDGNVGVAGQGAEFLNFLGAAHVQKEGTFIDSLVDLVGLDFGRSGLGAIHSRGLSILLIDGQFGGGGRQRETCQESHNCE